jgi:hypothetical protein
MIGKPYYTYLRNLYKWKERLKNFFARKLFFIVVHIYAARCCRVVKLRRMRRAGHVAHKGRREVYTGCWWGNLRERGHWGDPDIDGRIVLRWIFRKLEGVVGTGWSWLRIGTGGGHL